MKDEARELLGDLAALQSKSMAAEKRIYEAAVKRLAAVQKEIDRTKTCIEEGHDNEQNRYLALIRERGELDIVISKCKEVI